MTSFATPTVRPAGILGLGTYRPSRRVDNGPVSERIDSCDQWIRERSGIEARRIAAPDESVLDMATSAAAKALAASGTSASDIGLVVLATCSLPQLLPGGAPEIAHRLGATSAGALDISAACAGFTYALSLAANAVRSGEAEQALVIGAERMTDVIDPYDRGTAFLFGDGAGAAVVGHTDADGIGPAVWSHNGAARDAITIEHDTRQMRMQGQQVYRWATTTLPGLARSACERAGLEIDDLAAFIPHQANLRITDFVARSLRLPPSVAIARDIVDNANTSAASVPLAFQRLIERGEISQGDPVLLLGFGAGLTAAGQVARCP